MIALALAFSLVAGGKVSSDAHPGNNVLMETGDNVLMETGDAILMEA